jgi:hypothetical protein
MTKNAAFLADAHRLNLDISPISGDAVLRLVEGMEQTPKSVVAQFNSIVPPSD